MAGAAGTEEPINERFVAGLFNELEDVIKGKSLSAMSYLDQFIKDCSSHRLQEVKDFLHKKNIALIVHRELMKQPTRDGLQHSSNQSIYKFVIERLNDWTSDTADIERINERPGQDTHDPNDSIYKLVEWSALLWFVQQLANEKTKVKIFTHGTKMLFEKYFSEASTRCEVVFLRGVMDAGGDLMEQALKEFLEKSENIKNITFNGLSKDMTTFLSHYSKRYHIIPFPTDEYRMYAMHLYMRAFDESANNNYDMEPEDHANLEANQVRQNLVNGCRFEFKEPPLRGPYNWNIEDYDGVWNADNGTFKQLEQWIIPTFETIQDTCSMLFISFSLHGKQAHVLDDSDYKKIQDILGWIHQIEQLESIPKVVAIQACQHVPGAEGPKDESEEQRKERMKKLSRTTEELEGMSNELENFVKKMKNMTLLMAVERGEQYKVTMPPNTAKEADTYLTRLVKYMADSSESNPPTVEDAHQRAHKNDETKANRTVTESEKNKSVIFLHVAPKQEHEYTVWEHDAESSSESDEENYDEEFPMNDS